LDTNVSGEGQALHIGLGGLYGPLALDLSIGCTKKGEEIVVGESRIGEGGISILTPS